MALVFKDRVKVTSTTTGTGAFTLGSAVTGYQSFSVIGNGNTTQYTIVDDAGNWEVGTGTYTSSGTTLSRDTVLESSNSNSLVNFPAGTKTVFVTYAADKSVTIDNTATLTNKTMSGASNTFSNIPNSALVTTPVTSVTGTSPVNSSGGTTPAISLSSGYGDTQNPYASKTANNFLAAPDGTAGVPTFRAIVAADIPTLNQNTTGNAATATTATNLSGGTCNATTITATTSILPAADNTGVIGTAAATWNNGQFTNLTVDSTMTVTSTLNVRAAIDLADSDVLRMGTSDDWQLWYNGSTNKGQIEMEADCLGIQITDNGTEIAYIEKASGKISAKSFNATSGIIENSSTVSANYTIASQNNAVSAGPITIDTGVTVTVPTGSTWVVL